MDPNEVKGSANPGVMAVVKSNGGKKKPSRKRIFDWFGLKGYAQNPLQRLSVGDGNTYFMAREFRQDEEIDELASIESFSFSPFFSWYLGAGYLWDFLILEIALGLFWFKGMTTIAMRYLLEFRWFNYASYGIQLKIFSTIMVIIFLAVKIWECRVAKRLSWNRLEWDSLEDYERRYPTWNTLGIIGTVITGILLFIIFV